ncbi:hypothetical protein [Paracoccus sp. PAR01]|uniref:hypothetical protein n=1 Tax=Paracoccus sp. PAR01 TaxID=2769282 RepID=UPI00178558A0|nr:hypothetical protein [Paracoccus sp. PAR01]MBD9526207.1 hypothetical protein [Paracoccus sp. PAR01]
MTDSLDLLRRIAADPNRHPQAEDRPTPVPEPAPPVLRIYVQVMPPPTAGQNALRFVLGFVVAFGLASAVIAALLH